MDLPQENRLTLYAMCGLPFAGKSTLARELAIVLGLPVISPDEINHEFGRGLGEHIRSFEWEHTFATSYERTERLLWEGHSVIYDAANFASGQRDRLRSMLVKRALDPYSSTSG